MSKLACKNCKSVAVEYEDYVGGTSYYRCKTCGMRGNKDKFMQQSIFDTITSSPEVLAEKLVYLECIDGMWHSTIFPYPENPYPTREAAIAATVARLKEVCK